MIFDFFRAPVLGVDCNLANTHSCGPVEILLIFFVVLPKLFVSNNDFAVDFTSENLAGQVSGPNFLLELVEVAELLNDLLLELFGRRDVVFLPHPLHGLDDLEIGIQVHFLGLLQ